MPGPRALSRMDLGGCPGVTLLTAVQASGYGGMKCGVPDFVSSDVKARGTEWSESPAAPCGQMGTEGHKGEETWASIQGAVGRDVGGARTVLREAGQRR